MKKVLFVSVRAFGDAIINSLAIDSFKKQHKDVEIDVLCKSQVSCIFRRNKNVSNVYHTGIPFICNKDLPTRDFFVVLMECRKQKYDVCIDLIGDLRERLLCWFIKPKTIYSINRESGHLFNKQIKQGLAFLCKSINIPKSEINYYDQIDLFLRNIGSDGLVTPGIVKKEKSRIIGLHPFASQECRMWSWDKWNELINLIYVNGYSVKIFCSQQEKGIIERELDFKNIDVITGTIDYFFAELEKIDTLVCLDSFAMHAAYSVGIPTVMLNGANNPILWKSPTANVVTGNHSCKYWPCYNKPVCSHEKYQCIKSVSVENVWHQICFLNI